MPEPENFSHQSTDTDEFGNILNKISQIREFFKIGDEITPFLTELFAFLKDLVPLMTDVNHSLHLSTDKLPLASTSISQATDTTEVATFQMMDKLEAITDKLTRLIDTCNTKEIKLTQSIQNDIQDIMTTLQFQDIAAQQLEHANRILKVIFQRFSELFESLNKVRLTSKLGKSVLDALKRDSDDSVIVKQSRDFDEHTKDIIRNGNVSQDDIDKLLHGKLPG